MSPTAIIVVRFEVLGFRSLENKESDGEGRLGGVGEAEDNWEDEGGGFLGRKVKTRAIMQKLIKIVGVKSDIFLFLIRKLYPFMLK